MPFNTAHDYQPWQCGWYCFQLVCVCVCVCVCCESLQVHFPGPEQCWRKSPLSASLNPALQSRCEEFFTQCCHNGSGFPHPCGWKWLDQGATPGTFSEFPITCLTPLMMSPQALTNWSLLMSMPTTTSAFLPISFPPIASPPRSLSDSEPIQLGWPCLSQDERKQWIYTGSFLSFWQIDHFLFPLSLMPTKREGSAIVGDTAESNN